MDFPQTIAIISVAFDKVPGGLVANCHGFLPSPPPSGAAFLALALPGLLAGPVLRLLTYQQVGWYHHSHPLPGWKNFQESSANDTDECFLSRSKLRPLRVANDEVVTGAFITEGAVCVMVLCTS